MNEFSPEDIRSTSVRILVVDDQPKVRQGLRMMLALEPDLAIVGEAEDGTQALTLARSLHPDVVLMDVAMPNLDGIAATSALRAVAPEARVIMLSVHDDPKTRRQAEQAGAVAFVAKHSGHRTLVATLRQVVASDVDSE